MTEHGRETTVRARVIVDAPIERAFAVFTEGIGSWFPPEYNLLAAPIAERVFEPRVGGRVYDRGVDGSQCQWGRVLAYEPPRRVVISWDISSHWQVETDLAKTSEVEVHFTSEAPNRTRVDLQHRHIERHGKGWEQLRDSVGGEGGWPEALRQFALKLS